MNDVIENAALIEGLSLKAFFIKMADEHPMNFTNPDDIGIGWWRSYRDSKKTSPYIDEYCRQVNRQHNHQLSGA